MTLYVYRGRKTTTQQQPRGMISSTQLHSERPKLYIILTFLSVIGLGNDLMRKEAKNVELTVYPFNFIQFNRVILTVAGLLYFML